MTISRRQFFQVSSIALLSLAFNRLKIPKSYNVYLPLVLNNSPAFCEPWKDLNNWNPIGAPNCSIPEPCILEMNNLSAGIVSKRTFDRTKEITVCCKFRAQPNIGSSTNTYWGGMALYSNDGTDSVYGEIAVERNISWLPGPACKVISMTNNAHVKNLKIDNQPWIWHDTKIIYKPEGQYQYFVDGELLDTVDGVPLNTDPVIFLLCVSNGTDDGSLAQAQFGAVAVYEKG
jgi:hypothetical protein